MSNYDCSYTCAINEGGPSTPQEQVRFPRQRILTQRRRFYSCDHGQQGRRKSYVRGLAYSRLSSSHPRTAPFPVLFSFSSAGYRTKLDPLGKPLHNLWSRHRSRPIGRCKGGFFSRRSRRDRSRLRHRAGEPSPHLRFHPAHETFVDSSQGRVAGTVVERARYGGRDN